MRELAGSFVAIAAIGAALYSLHTGHDFAAGWFGVLTAIALLAGFAH